MSTNHVLQQLQLKQQERKFLEVTQTQESNLLLVGPQIIFLCPLLLD